MKKISCIAVSLILLSAGKTAYSMKNNTENDSHSNRTSQDHVMANLCKKEVDLYKYFEELQHEIQVLPLGPTLKLRINDLQDEIGKYQDLYKAIESLLLEDEKYTVNKLLENTTTCLQKKIDFIKKYKDKLWILFALPLHEQLEEMKDDFPEREEDLKETLKNMGSNRFFRESSKIKIMKEELENINNECWKTYVGITEFIIERNKGLSIESNIERSKQPPPHTG